MDWRRMGNDEVSEGAFWWLADASISLFLVIFAGLMSGLTLGLMSLGIVDLEVLQRSGTPTQKKQAAAIFPVVQNQHQLLVTLLLCNAAAMEALPIFLDNMFSPVLAVILSVTLVLAFGEVIPQAICSRYGLAVGANLVWLVRVLMLMCAPVAWPVGKGLDYLLGHDDSALFRRAQLKALVSIHGQEAGKGGELSHDETTIISGALDLTEKTAEEAMTPIESTFSLDVHTKLDWEAMGKILARGHSRVPVYDGNPRNIIGLLLVKSLLTVRAEAETPVSAVSIRRIPRVPGDMPLYDILNEFQKGSSHMAAVVKTKIKRKPHRRSSIAEVLAPQNQGKLQNSTTDFQSDIEKGFLEKVTSKNPGHHAKHKSDRTQASVDDGSYHEESNWPQDDSLSPGTGVEEVEQGEVIGIITLEDVIEELLQEEIVDETDEYIDVHKRIRVAAAAAAVQRGSSIMRRVGSKSAASFSRPAVQPGKVQFVEDDLSSNDGLSNLDSRDSLRQPLLLNKAEEGQA